MALLTLAASAGAARAEPKSTAHELRRGIVASGTLLLGTNSDDDAIDFSGTFPYTGFELGYRLHTGTEAYVAAGLGNGGHEALVMHYGIGVRQRLLFGRFEPYVEGGRFWVGDGANTPLAWAVGGGGELWLRPNLSASVGFGHYFSKDTDGVGALDWYTRANVTWLISW